MPNAAEQRQKQVFRAVVREYLRTAEPVGSEAIASRFDVSPATIRNDMADLETRGLLEQPHTSAGRIPTDRGYRFYVEQFVDENRAEIAASRRKRIETALAEWEADATAAIKSFAKAVAALTDETVFWSFGDDAHLIGMGNLVRKPEFRESDLIETLSRAFDDADAAMTDVGRRHRADVDVFIGDENPFGPRLSSVLAACDVPGFGEVTIGILGPTRMDYDANVALMRYVHHLLEHLA